MFDQNLFNFGFSRKLRLVSQTEGAECGLACVAMIADYFGHRTDLFELRQRFPISLKGTHFPGLMQIAQELGLATRAVKTELTGLKQLKLPCVLHWNFNHFVVLKSVGRSSITIYDPGGGVRIVDMSEVSTSFTGVALEAWPNDSFASQPAPPPVRLRDMLGAVTGWRRSVGQLVLLGLALEVFALLSPLLLQWIVDNVLVSGDTDLLTTLIIGFSAVLLAHQAIISVRSWGIIYLSTSLDMQWRSNVLTHLLSLPVQYFEKRHLGDVMSRFGAVERIQKTLSTSFLETILDGLMAAATLVMMLIYSPLLSLIAIATVTVYLLIRWSLYKAQRDASEETILHAARQESQLLETVRGIKTIKIFQRQQERRSTWLRTFIDKLNADLKVQRLDLLFKVLNGIAAGAENIAILGIGAHLVLGHTISVGVLLAFIAYKNQFDSRFTALIDKLFELRLLRLHVERLADIVMTKADPQVPATGHQLPETPSVELAGVSFRYASQEPLVLEDVSLNIAPGESIAITGPSGGGKSTLLHLLLGVQFPTAGKIRVGGMEMTPEGVQLVRGVMGAVLQDDVLFAGSIAANISFFDPAMDMEWVRQCAAYAAIDEEIRAMPMGFDTLVGDMGTVLSGGQKQRVLIARALYRRPKILFLDEATSHLDPHSEQKVNAAISKLKITRVSVAHRSETIASADRRIVLANGRIVEDCWQRLASVGDVRPFGSVNSVA